MKPEQVRLVQESFAKVEPIAQDAAALFYDRLFTLDPSLRHMFKGDMEEQGRKLMRMLSIVVHNLTRLGGVMSAITHLGRKHVEYGVKQHHYDTVAEALLWTLEQGLGEHWNAAVKDAWTAAYTTLAGAMTDVAHDARRIA